MTSLEVTRISNELEAVGYSLTTFDSLGVELDSDKVTKLCEKTETSDESAAALSVVEHIEREGMTIIQDEVCIDLGRCVMKPVVEELYKQNEAALDSWKIFGINRYVAGGRFGTHRDSVDATILLATLLGEREFEIYDNGKSEPGSTDFTRVQDTFLLTPGDIMILDGEKDPAHAVSRAKTSSIVVVVDVPLPNLLRVNR